MKPLILYACVISLSSLAAAVQPSEEPPELHAAMAVADTGPGDCTSAACQSGWQAASNHGIYDVSDCRQLSQERGEVQGCEAFVNAVLEERLENQW